MEKTWWKEGVVYQIYPRSFNDSNGDGIGDLNGITEKLDYLKELGIDVIWLSPVYQSPNDDNGYDISDYKAIMKDFGTMEDFDRMLATAHEKGIRIVMDLVVNHTSDEHAWFVESRKSKDNPYRDYYIWREGKEEKAPNNWGSCFGGPAWERDPETDMYYLHLFSKKQPDLNWDNEKVRQEVFSMMEWWCQKGIDGLRMDVISMISKMPGLPDGVVGESFKWNDRKIDLVELKQTLSKWQDELYEKAWNSLYWCNHDQPRMISRLGDTSTRELRESSAKMLGTCLHMMQGTPYVFQGEELGMTNTTFESLDDFRDIESINAYHQYTENGQIKPDDMMRYLRYKSRDNARTPMQWDDSPNAGFTEGTPWIKVNPNYKEINAKEQMAREDSVFHYYQKLIRLRKENEIIVYGKYQLLMEEDPNLYVYTRTLGGERLLVICNFRKEPQKFLLPEGFTPEDGEILIGNYEGQKVEQTMVLRAFETMAVKF